MHTQFIALNVFFSELIFVTEIWFSHRRSKLSTYNECNSLNVSSKHQFTSVIQEWLMQTLFLSDRSV